MVVPPAIVLVALIILVASPTLTLILILVLVPVLVGITSILPPAIVGFADLHTILALLSFVSIDSS